MSFIHPTLASRSLADSQEPAAYVSNAQSARANTAPSIYPACSVFLRGSHVSFMVLPDILKNAPFFKKIDTKANKASKAGKAKQVATQRAAGESIRVFFPWSQARACARLNGHGII